MKRNYLFLVFCMLLCLSATGQQRNSAVDDFMLLQVKKGNLQPSDIANYKVTAQHVSSASDVNHIYFRQTYNGIEIIGTESSIHIKNGKLIQGHNSFLKDIHERIVIANPIINEIAAIQSVSSKMGYTQKEAFLQLSKNVINRVTTFSNGGVSLENIPVKLVYKNLPHSKLVATWELSVKEISGSNWYNFFVDASSGDILEKVNWTISCTIHNHDHSSLAIVDNKNNHVNDVTTSENIPVMENGTYNVFPLPVESPLHGDRAIVNDPHDLIASPFGWHDTDGMIGPEFTVTRGNNVNAYEDGDNFGYQPDGGTGLIFDFPFDPVYTASNQSEDAAITNLFYWNNVTHDILYLYGLDEASGNFQVNNYGNGGFGNDSVNAEAQDGAGTCNANFATPPDGISPTMQMFICGDRDGDYDNQVIIHEYGHGISIRLTGGAGDSGCLFNDEQMGEGWSDWYGTVMTIEEGDIGTDPRPVGNYLFQQDADGPGIRDFPYSTDLSVDPRTYDYIQTTAGPHPLGSTWAAMLWEVTWALIDEYGFDSDIYNGSGGNNIAMALVTEGLKLQPCSPGFVDGRDAILAADIALYGGANQCLIWEAFAKRGLGQSADQGSSDSRFDGAEAFDSPATALEIAEESFCISEDDIILGGGLPIGGIYSGSGVTNNGDGETFTFSPATAGIGEHIITYVTESDCDGGDTDTDIITVTDITPIIECQDITVTLDENGMATITPPDVVTNFLPGEGYTIDQAGAFNPIAISSGTTVTLSDDDVSAPISFGFDFVFFGEVYSNFQISSNGFLTMGSSNFSSGCCNGPFIPSAGGINNFIAFAWEDINPGSGGTIRYSIEGTAPNRIMVVEFDDVPYFGSSNTVTSQVHLYETSGLIEIHSLSIPDNGTMTQGIENIGGTEGLATSGRNATFWGATNDYVAFIPNAGGFSDTCGNETNVALDIDSFNCDNLGENTVTATATDSEGNSSSCTAIVTIISNIDVTFTLDETFCEDQEVVTGLGGGLPLGGVYSGVGITDDANGETFTLDPGVSGEGSLEITYTANNSCDDMGSVTISVDILPAIPELICQDIEVYLDENGEIIISPELILLGNMGGDLDPGDAFLYALDPFQDFDNIARYIYNPSSNTITVDNTYSYSTNLNNGFAFDEDITSGITYLLAGSSTNRSLYSLDLNDTSSNPSFIADIVSGSGNTNAQDMVFDNDGNLYIIFQGGEIEVYNPNTLEQMPFTTVASGGSVGMTFDFDNDRLIVASGSNPVNLLQVNATTGASMIIFSFDSPDSTFCSAQAIEYIGNDIVLASATGGCNAVYTVNLDTEETDLLLDPSGTFSNIKELHLASSLPTDNCSGEPLTFTISPDAFTCDNLGENEVTITATDSNGNTSSCASIVTILPFEVDVVFELSDTVFCEDNDIITGLGGGTPEGGMYSGPGVTDDNNGLTFTFDPSAAGIGIHEIMYTVATSCDEESSAIALIEVLPGIPDIECQDIVIALDNSCEIELTPEMLLNGSEGFLFALDPFNSINNIARFEYNVQTNDILLDASYSYSTGFTRNFALDQDVLTGSTYLLAGDSANRDLYQLNLDNPSEAPEFISDVVSASGNNNSQDMVFDNQGNLYIIFQGGEINTFDLNTLTAIPFATITTSNAVGITFDKDENRLIVASGTGLITLVEVAIPSGESNTMFSFNTPTAANCSSQGIEYLDNGKLISSSTFGCNVIYTLDLNTQEAISLLDPVGTTFDDHKELHFTGGLPVDNCSGDPLTFEIVPPILTCDDVGENEVIVTATDSDGNTSSCTSIVTILPPVEIECMNIIVALDENGMATITPDDVLIESMDGASLDISEFNCTNLGENVVTVTVVQDGQMGSCEAIVTLIDELAPTAECPDDFTVMADAGGTTYTIEDYTSLVITSDNCSVVLAQSPSEGTLANVGDVVEISITATDPSGNSNTCTFNITVSDACDLPEVGSFTGAYFMEQLTPTIFGYDTFIDFDNSALTFFEGETDPSQQEPFIPLELNQRSFDANYIAILGFDNTLTYIIDFEGCNENVTFSGEETTGLACGGDSILLGPDEGGSFDPEDDSEFIFSFQDDITDACGTGSPNVLIRFTREPLAIGDVQFDNQIAVYPNPTSDSFSIRNRGGFPLTQAIITDVNGRILQSVDLENSALETQISLADYADGLYFVQILSENANVIKRVVKN